MQAAEFLSLSEWLLEEGSRNGKASLRTAANGAYLASALSIFEVLHSRLGIDIPRTAQFYRIFEDHSVKLDAFLKYSLISLRDFRNRADYDLIFDFDRNEAERAVNLAREVIAHLSEEFH